MIKQNEKYTFRYANAQSVSSPHSSPFPCPLPSLISFPLIWTFCIKGLTFSLHFTHNLCTSLQLANNFQACKSRYELALVLTARSDYTNREISPCISNVLPKQFRGHYPLFHFISLDLLYTGTPDQVSSQNIYNT